MALKLARRARLLGRAHNVNGKWQVANGGLAAKASLFLQSIPANLNGETLPACSPAYWLQANERNDDNLLQLVRQQCSRAGSSGARPLDPLDPRARTIATSSRLANPPT